MSVNNSLLYIEDNPANMRLVEQVMKQFPDIGFMGEETAIDGINTAEAKQPGLILMDIQLPEMDGFQALTELKGRENTRYIPVFAISANAMNSDKQKGLDHGFDDYITKPLDIQKFIAMIRKHFMLD